MCSNGKWQLESHGIITCGLHGVIALSSMDRESNAQFICTCANQCQAINPNNPQAVADGLVDMYEALKNTRDLFKDKVDVFDDWFEEVERALAKVEAK